MVRQSRFSNPNGRPTVSCTSSPTGAAGGISIATAPGRWSRSARSRPSSGCRSGSSGCRPTPSSGPGQLVCTYLDRGTWRLARLDTNTRRLTPVGVPYTSISGLRATRERAVFIGSSPTESPAVVLLDLASDRGRRAPNVQQRNDRSRVPFIGSSRSSSRPSGGLTAHALLLRSRGTATSPRPPSERPPLLVMSHGGPTGAASAAR